MEQAIIDRSSFAEQANACGTDKASMHGYQRFYPLVLSQLNSSEPFTIVEIGYGDGSSISLWKRLFPHAYLICIDRDVNEKGDGYMVIQADQDQPEQLKAVLHNPPSPVRLVIDDGSHHPRHQINSFSLIFETVLEPGGFYIVEDIETSYWLDGDIYGYKIRAGLFSRWSAIEAFKLAIDYANRAFLAEEDRALIEYSMFMAGLDPAAASMIASVTFGQNCVLVAKSMPEDNEYQERPYIFGPFTSRH